MTLVKNHLQILFVKSFALCKRTHFAKYSLQIFISELTVDFFRFLEVWMKNPTCTLYGGRSMLFDVAPCYWKSLCKIPRSQNSWRNESIVLTNRIAGKRMNIKKIKLLPNNQDQDSLLVKRRNDNHSPGPVIRELVPSSQQRSELSNTILCIFSGWDQRIGEGIPIPDNLGEEVTFINICIGNGSLKCHRVLIPTTPSFGDKVICWYTGFTFKTFI